MTPTGGARAPRGGLGGDTPILMADGRRRLLADLRIGDRVYGTIRDDNYHRYSQKQVTAIRAAVQHAYRVKLADGTEIVTAADQCFLTYRGWKHVTGAEQGLRRRPHLTVGANLLGTGHTGAPPDQSLGYRRGYLCGLIRGDGHVASYSCVRVGQKPWVKHGFRLALADLEALERAREYLIDAGVPVKEFVFQRAAPGRRQVTALGNQSRAGVNHVRQLIRWPPMPGDAWRSGFLAGIFDAEGSCGPRAALRIGNTDTVILQWTETCMRHFGFDVVREPIARANGMTYIRLRGGLRERLRFFHTTDPAITRKRIVDGLALQSDADLRVTSIEPLGRTLRLYGVAAAGDLIANGLVTRSLPGSGSGG